jgi:CubicO group peptidase (beta-lactamase class C family)
MTATLPALPGEIRAFAGDVLARWGVPGAAIGILRDGEAAFASFGVSSLETQQPVTPETLFRVASISKPFTATLVMTLVHDGLLDLDAPIIGYLPGIALSDGPADWQEAITMRHLLSHTAGIDCELGVDLAAAGMGDDALTAAIGHYGSLHQWGAPGPVMSYGNTGFWLAGHVAATILGQSFEDAMRERVFAPLGLERSVYTAEEAIVYPVALGHQPTSLTGTVHELIRSYAYPRARRPSGGVISTVVDLLRFAGWHMGGFPADIHLSSQLRDAMRDPVIRLRAADAEAWGIGWNLDPANDGTVVIGHGGSFGGFQTQLTLVPERGWAMAILTNSGRGGMANAEIEHWLLANDLGLDVSDPAPVPLAPEALAPFAGAFRQPEASFAFSVADGGLEMAFTEAYGPVPGEVPPPVRLLPVGERDFLAVDGPFKGTRADFIPDPETGDFTKVRVGVRVARRISGADRNGPA